MTASRVLTLCLALAGCSQSMSARETTDLFNAAASGDVDFVRKELRRGVDPNLYSEDRGYLLAASVLAPNAAVAQALVDAGADVNARKGKEITPLLRAVFVFSCEPARVLLKAGANADARLLDYENYAVGREYKDISVREMYFMKKRDLATLWKKEEACWLQVEGLMKTP